MPSRLLAGRQPPYRPEMLDSGSSATEASPSSSSTWSTAPTSAPIAETTAPPAIQTTFIDRGTLAERTWTFACILSFAGHVWAVTAYVLAAILWNLWPPDTFLPPGASAGGRPAGSNAAGIIGVAPGYQEKDSGDSEHTGGIVRLGAPQQIGNQLANEPEVAGNILEAKKFTETQVTATTEPVEIPTLEVQKSTTQIARTLDVPLPENDPEPTPRAVVSRRVASTRIATALAASALQVEAPKEIPAIEVLPQAVVRHEAPDDAVASSVTPPQDTPVTEPKPATPVATNRSPMAKATEKSDAPVAPEDSKGLARRAGTKVLAKAVTRVELDKPGAGGGAGGPGGNSGGGGRGGATNDGPGGAGVGRTNGSDGDLRSLLVHAPKPYYPRELDEAGISGSVMLHVEIDPAGNVLGVKVHRSSGYAAFDRSALEGVAKWKFVRLVDKPWRSNVYLVPVQYND